MKITVNGDQETIEPCTIGEFIKGRDLNPAALVVELNQQILKRERWDQTRLEDDDTLELLNFVGGG